MQVQRTTDWRERTTPRLTTAEAHAEMMARHEAAAETHPSREIFEYEVACVNPEDAPGRRRFEVMLGPLDGGGQVVGQLFGVGVARLFEHRRITGIDVGVKEPLHLAQLPE